MQTLTFDELKALLENAHSAGVKGVPFEIYFESLRNKAAELSKDLPPNSPGEERLRL